MRAGMRALAAALVGLAAAAAGAPPAWAGTYDVVACNAPGARGVNNSWSWSVGALNGATDDDRAKYALLGSCGSPAGLSGSSNPNRDRVRWGTFANFAFSAPAGTAITRVVLWRYGTGTVSTDDPNTPENESGRWEVNAQFDGNALFADTCHAGAGIWPNPCHTGAPSFSDASRVIHDGRGQMFTVGIFCGGDAGAPYLICYTANGAGNPLGYLNFQGAKVTLEDNSAPTLKVGGPLLSGGWRKRGDLLAYDASDNAGVRAARLEIAGKTRRVAASCDYRRPVPCASRRAATLGLPPGTPDGVHNARIVAEDAAGNGKAVARQIKLDTTAPAAVLRHASGRTIVVAVSDATSAVASAGIEVRNKSNEPYRALAGTLANGTLSTTLDRGSASRIDIRVTVRDVAGNVAQGTPTRLAVTRAKFGRRSRRVRSNRVKVPFGRRATLRGRLTLSAGQPLAGQTIGVASTVRRRGARTRLAGAVKTGPRGRFSIRIPAGPSRALRFVYGGAPGVLGATRGISYRVPASSTIHASRTRLFGEGRVRFSGRLRSRGQRIPARGLVLVLQGRERGHWRTFDDTRSNGKGRWHATYHFSGRPGTYPIRLKIRRQTSYPFELGYSRALTVRVS